MQIRLPNRRTPIRWRAALAALLAASFATGADALPLTGQAGSGPESSFVQVDFSDGASFVWEVFYDTAGGTAFVTGLDLLQTLEAELAAFSLDLLVFSFGTVVDGITFGSHSNVGFGGGEDFWHYWARDDAAGAWGFSPFGADVRTVADGSWDGWRYGSAAAPVAEPATLALLAAGLALGARGRRRAVREGRRRGVREGRRRGVREGRQRAAAG
jgi:hypothetical protein